MAIARNMVIAGDFKGAKIELNKKRNSISFEAVSKESDYGARNRRYGLSKASDVADEDMYNGCFDYDGVTSYQLVNEDISKSPGDVLMGGLAFGAIGALIGSSVTQKIYTIAIELRQGDVADFEDDSENGSYLAYCKYKLLIEIDDTLYRAFIEHIF